MIQKAQEIEKEAQPYWVGRMVAYKEWVRVLALTRQEAIESVRKGKGNWTGQMEFNRVLHKDSWDVQPEDEADA